jgi:hypothetical protein
VDFGPDVLIKPFHFAGKQMDGAPAQKSCSRRGYAVPVFD